jgi:hypothetical protein
MESEAVAHKNLGHEGVTWGYGCRLLCQVAKVAEADSEGSGESTVECRER